MNTAPGTIGLYIHVPFCRHACPYCDFYKFELRERPASLRLEFLETTARELDLQLRARPDLAARQLDTIYFGGGTPSTLHPGRFRRFLESVFAAFPEKSQDLEVTLEANPENLTAARARQWHEAGVNRVSMGVQSFDATELELLERLHEPATIFKAIGNIRNAGVENYSIDLIFALPGQTMEKWEENLRRAVDLEPPHVSLYGLTWHEGTPFHRQLANGSLRPIPEDREAEMFLRASEFLADHGYTHYEVSNFSLPGFQSRHNQRYWTGADVLPLGPGAHGNLGQERWANPDDIDKWGAAIRDENLPGAPIPGATADILLAERLYTRLRRREGVRRESDPELFALCERWYRGLESPEERRRGDLGDTTFHLSLEGWLLLDPIVDQIVS